MVVEQGGTNRAWGERPKRRDGATVTGMATETLTSTGEHALDTTGQSRTALVSVAAATVLVVLKLGTGILTGSLGLISAGVESSGDVVAAVLTFLAIRLGGRPADEDHHYGHRRAENLGALGEAAILLGGGIFIVIEAIGRSPPARVATEVPETGENFEKQARARGRRPVLPSSDGRRWPGRPRRRRPRTRPPWRRTDSPHARASGRSRAPGWPGTRRPPHRPSAE